MTKIKMVFNVSGETVATGVHDPMIMFYAVGIILVIALVVGIFIYLISLFK